MTNYQEAIVKLTNAHLNKLKSSAKNKTGTTLRLTKKNFEDKELSHELILWTRQTTKIRNVFANKMSTDKKKISKTQISKIIQSGGSLGSWLGNLGKKTLANIVIPLPRDNVSGLVIKLTSNESMNQFERKISGKGIVRAGKGSTLFISNGDINDIITIIKLLEDLCVLIDGAIETVKHEIKNKKADFSGLC